MNLLLIYLNYLNEMIKMTILKKQDYKVFKGQYEYWCTDNENPCKECISYKVCETCIRIKKFLLNFNKIFFSFEKYIFN